jgi:hypothetical protein
MQSISFYRPEVLNKGPAFWLDGARHANTFIPSPSWGIYMRCAAIQYTLPQKYVCKYIKLKIASVYQQYMMHVQTFQLCKIAIVHLC